MKSKEIDKTDPICGMKGTIPAHGHYFCSQHCIEKYEQQQNIDEDQQYCPSCQVNHKQKWYKQKLFIVTILTSLILLASYFIPMLDPFTTAFSEYFQMIWWAILLGFLIGGFIDYFIPQKYIEKYLSLHNKKTIIYAILFGFLMSACSHGILAIAMELYKKGANTSAVIAFLLASPWANLPVTILLFGFFGLNAILLIISALVIAAITGTIYIELEKKGLIECKHCENGIDKHYHNELKSFSIKKDIKKRFNSFQWTKHNIFSSIKKTLSGSWSLANMMLWWLIIGMLMASFARAYIPQNLFQTYMGPGIIGLIITLIFATIIEVCSEGTAPLAFEIFTKTGAFGNSFLFLMAGVSTDYTEIGLIWQNIGKKAALFLPLITVPQILLLGYIFNMIT
jgi:uncharacterized membrane protein YraQ (UPF0718 family)